MRLAAKPVIQQFKIEGDSEGLAWVEFRQARFGDAQTRAQYRARARFVKTSADAQIAVEQEFNELEAMALDLHLTMTNIGGFYDENDKEVEIFKFEDRGGVQRVKGSVKDFVRRIDEMGIPESIVREMHRHCLAVNTQWDDNAKGE